MDRRTQEAGTGRRWGGSKNPGVSQGSRTLRKPRIRERPLPRWTLLPSGFWSGERPREPGIGRGARFSRPGVPLKSAVARAAREHSAPPHPRRGTASVRRALTPAAPLSPPRSPGEGGDTKAPRRSQSEACFLGRRGDTPPQEPTAQPIHTRRRPGTLGAVVTPARMLQTFAK